FADYPRLYPAISRFARMASAIVAEIGSARQVVASEARDAGRIARTSEIIRMQRRLDAICVAGKHIPAALAGAVGIVRCRRNGAEHAQASGDGDRDEVVLSVHCALLWLPCTV